ncbi:glycosyltransferase [Microbacterium sp. HJ5]
MSPLAEPGWICLAVYKPDPALLAEQLSSIRAQSLRTWTCEIGIDGADPAARELVRRLTEDDERFRVTEFADNVGFYRNFERLLGRVPREIAWVALSDQDDRWYPGKFETLVPFLGSAALVTGQAQIVDRTGEEIAAPTLRRVVGMAGELIDNQVTGSLCLFRRTLLDVALPFPAPTDAAYHDHWLAVCALAAGGITISPEFVQGYVQHDANVIGEERGSSVRARFHRLAARSEEGGGGRLEYLRANRWGWRVRMAGALLTRRPDVDRDARRTLQAVAADRLSPSLLGAFVGAVARREAPALRALALLIGAGWFRPRIAP